MPTFGQLRRVVIKEAGTEDLFRFRGISSEHNAFWEEINAVEFKKGYVPGEYEKPGSQSLCEMELLTLWEFNEWVGKFKKIHKAFKRRNKN